MNTLFFVGPIPTLATTLKSLKTREKPHDFKGFFIFGGFGRFGFFPLIPCANYAHIMPMAFPACPLRARGAASTAAGDGLTRNADCDGYNTPRTRRNRSGAWMPPQRAARPFSRVYAPFAVAVGRAGFDALAGQGRIVRAIHLSPRHYAGRDTFHNSGFLFLNSAKPSLALRRFSSTFSCAGS